jgi:hypothetical protein
VGRKASSNAPWLEHTLASKELGEWPDEVIALSAIPFDGTLAILKAMTLEDIERFKQEFGRWPHPDPYSESYFETLVGLLLEVVWLMFYHSWIYAAFCVCLWYRLHGPRRHRLRRFMEERQYGQARSTTRRSYSGLARCHVVSKKEEPKVPTFDHEIRKQSLWTIIFD